MRKDFSDRFFENPQKLNPQKLNPQKLNPQKLSTDSKIWNLGLGLSASVYTTIKCVIELMDADLRLVSD
jgi:hypothetical protein